MQNWKLCSSNIHSEFYSYISLLNICDPNLFCLFVKIFCEYGAISACAYLTMMMMTETLSQYTRGL